MYEYRPATVSLDQLDALTRTGVELALQEREIVASNLSDPTSSAAIMPFDPTLMGYASA